MADTKTTTTPRRTRAAASKPAAPAAAKPDTEAPMGDGKQRIVLEMEYTGDTKSYAVFVPPAGTGCVGKFYAPLGTAEVKVALIGPAD